MNLTRTAIARPVTVSMFLLAVILFGVVSLDRLALNLLPDISYPSLTVQTDYLDSAPEEVENLITRPVEEAVGVVSGLTRLSSISHSGQSEVVLEFGWGTDMNLAALDVREKLDFVTLPRDAEKPVILRFDPSYDPIMRLRLSGDMNLAKLRHVADRELKKALESTDGVAAIKVIGGIEEQIHVAIDEKRLAELGIPITEVSAALGQENLNQAAGSLYDQDANYLVRMLNQFRSVDEIEQIVIRNEGGRRILLGDVARVWRGAKERTIIARLNGKDSVELSVYKEGDANTVTVARAVQEKLQRLKNSDLFPKDVEYEVVFSQAEFISQAVSDVLSAAVLGGILAILILFIFLRDLRSTLTIGFSIPISIMATFALMYQTDITLNIMSLGGVALGVGMLVDNSIVVLESVHRHKQKHDSLLEAVYEGTREVGMAVTASTLTTVAVFLPLVFVEGIAGQLFTDQALTITYALLASLLVALTFLPMVLAFQIKRTTMSETPVREAEKEELTAPPTARRPVSRLGKVLQALRGASRFTSKWGRAGARFIFVDISTVVLTDLRRLVAGAGRMALKLLDPPLNAFEKGFNRLNGGYPKVLTWALNNKSVVLASALALVALAAWMSLRLGAELIPPLTQGEFAFEIKLPEGKPLETTNRVLRRIESTVAGYPEVRTVFSSVGGSAKNQFSREAQEENLGQLYVVLKDKSDKPGEERVIARIREELGRFPEVIHTFSRPTLFSFKTPVEVEIYGFDLGDLRLVAEKVARRLEEIPGLSDVQTSTELGNPEIDIRFDREKLARLGLDETQITNVLRNKIRGDVATRYREEDRQIDILVRAQQSERNSIEDIKTLVVNSAPPPAAPGQAQVQPGATSTGLPGNLPTEVVPIRLGAVAQVAIGRGPAEIRRIRSQRAAVVSANLSGRALSRVSQQIRDALQDLRSEIPPAVTLSLAGQNEELSTSYSSLAFALALAVFLVYLVMASQFESLVHPFIILFTVPLALIGVVISLFVTGTTISVMVLLGIIILAGIVVNNAIVLVDYANQLRRRSLPKRAALLEAGQVRLRPIVMTTMTTILGLIPMAVSWGEGAEIRAPMAITVIGGLLFSTLLTLIFIPVVYELVDRKAAVAEEASASRQLAASGELPQTFRPATGD
ncbi:MAG: efflux RND transporter permease subunit [Acidobacteriota bacterium]